MASSMGVLRMMFKGQAGCGGPGGSDACRGCFGKVHCAGEGWQLSFPEISNLRLGQLAHLLSLASRVTTLSLGFLLHNRGWMTPSPGAAERMHYVYACECSCLGSLGAGNGL